MAIIPPNVSEIIAGNMAAASILGVSQLQLANAISVGFTNYILSSVVINTIDVGVAGVGVGVGQGLIIVPSALQLSFTSNFVDSGINGVFQQPLAFALSNAMSQSLLTSTILTQNTGVGVGTGNVSALLVNSGISIPTMIAAFVASAIVGVASVSLATAIALSIDSVLPTARGFIIISGAGSISPGSGIGIGKIV